jgi:alpha-glucosidase
MQSSPCDQSMAFTLGSDLLVASSPKPESPYAYDICLPGDGWYDYWTGAQLHSSRTSETPRLDHLPVFVRAGAIIPRQPLVQSTSETPKGPLELDVYPGDDCRGEIYLDDGVSISGPSLRQSLSCRVTPSGISLSFGERQGSFTPWWKSIAIVVHGAHGSRKLIADQPHATSLMIH